MIKALGFAATADSLPRRRCAGFTEAPGSARSFAVAKSHFASYGTNRIHTDRRRQQTIVLSTVNSIAMATSGASGVGIRRQARVLVDLPGHGRSEPPTRYTPDFLRAPVQTVMRDVHVGRRCSLV
jgi:hypothetical protein